MQAQPLFPIPVPSITQKAPNELQDLYEISPRSLGTMIEIGENEGKTKEEPKKVGLLFLIALFDIKANIESSGHKYLSPY